MKYLVLTLLSVALVSAGPTPIKKITKSIGGRIIGGGPANAGEFPFAAAIYHRTSEGTYFCGGALINTQWVITAAHCVQDSLSFTVHLGTNELDGNSPNHLILSTSSSVMYPDFDPATLNNDLGLIEFRAPIEYNDYIQPVYWPTVDLIDNLPVIAIGWGSTDDQSSDLSNKLNFVQVVTLPNDECKMVYGNQISDTMVCVEGSYNEGACRGDLGGPLVIMLNHHAWHVGISSFISGNGCESTDPSGYTRTFSYIDWIKETTGEA